MQRMREAASCLCIFAFRPPLARMATSLELPVYLDHNATTPLEPAVAAAMRPFLEEVFGNPSSTHPYGARARQAVEQARANVATMLNAKPHEVLQFKASGLVQLIDLSASCRSYSHLAALRAQTGH